ncbi:MAG: ParA family protein [Pirellulaceae bacterium]
MRPVIVCLINQKGGCGKSSTCFHLAGDFAQSGAHVLLVDGDPQGSLSQGFFGSELIESLGPHETLPALFQEELSLAPETLRAPTSCDRISIVRANQHLARYNVPCPETTGLKQFALESWLSRVTDVGLVLIDCPPNLYACSWNALLAADFVLIPVPPEDFGTQGLRPVHQAIANARLLNPRLTLLGHVITRSDRRLLVHQTYEQKLRGLYGSSVLETVIPEASAYKVALACRQPVSRYAPRSRATCAMRQLAIEITERAGSHRCQKRSL